ncbi:MULTISPECIES: hypothetical protein [unclassified Actinomyces]|uniref:hypothetical protein n=1 Tax=unclassified Actinomyces TaxID=2609248 RepID=UPI0020182F87|nr:MULTISPECIES: hypothetical protein [unclassified Actinomyces]
MSAAHAYATGTSGYAGTRTESAPRPTLYAVRGLAPARTSLPLILVVILILVAALASSMVLNATMADTAFKMQQAQIRLNILNDHIDTVRSQVQDASAADSLAQRATELGMVPAGAPGVVDLTTGTVSGGSAAKQG